MSSLELHQPISYAAEKNMVVIEFPYFAWTEDRKVKKGAFKLLACYMELIQEKN